MAGHAQRECPERAKRVEGPWTHLLDDGIVVGVVRLHPSVHGWFPLHRADAGSRFAT